ncbi:post-illumination chlorophyll fluorescence increase [Klebsormidium nitens]|uniref:Post-illumination chlorophyll fluorescence increase n=1 Tax=Klebsormidium nitens TaxID=105231 RepID=A0A1Y1I4J8_KLENI|nr:post-illumination chlorophyll fluorescence increase [Klebsormidium nitens]|eukprot:GAQ85423.1 post-illumination chlorophyll fluorescence increase [Klebsormidium nitens]
MESPAMPGMQLHRRHSQNAGLPAIFRYGSTNSRQGYRRAIEATVASPSKSAATLISPTGTTEYPLPSWSKFESGECAVFWETTFGRPPASGEPLKIYFNARGATELNIVDDYVAFNGGFNQPIMCGGTPRSMTKNERGPHCDPFYSIRINVPVHAQTLEFSFTDGKEWHGSYKLSFEMPTRFRNQPQSFFDQGLAAELSAEDGCETAIFPDSVIIQDRCMMPGGMGLEGGDRCMLDINPGCMDPASPFYDPLANVDDGSCDLDGF